MSGVDAVASSDLLIVGSGLAGLTVALEARDLEVTILSKTGFGAGGSSPMAQGGVAAAVGEGDSPAEHAADTEAAAAGLAEPEIVALLTEEGPARVAELIRLGTDLDRDAQGRLALGREAAHGRPRILHARGDATGAEIVRALTEAVVARPRIEIVEQAFATDLVLEQSRVVGCWARHSDGRRVLYLARAVVLTTGGIGQLYSHTTNAAESTADGLAMAARAGACLTDLEFVQFHPTALAAGGDPMPLLTEALRGAGARVVDAAGRRFLEAVHPQADLAPRDVVARAIHQLEQGGGRAYLDLTPLAADLERRFPTAVVTCRRHGLDPANEPIPIAPAAHFHMGGISIDPCGRSSLVGLWAAGEAARSGAHGANRLASNSLLEAMVFGARVAASVGRLIDDLPAAKAVVREARASGTFRRPQRERAASVRARLREVAWRDLGLRRDRAGLEQTPARFRQLAAELGPGASEEHNLLLAGSLVATAALARIESRGAHFRRDYPYREPTWRRSLDLLYDSRRGAATISGGEPLPALLPALGSGGAR